MEAYHILIVEDDKEILDGVGIYMKNQGYEVFKAQNGLEGLKILEKRGDSSGDHRYHDADHGWNHHDDEITGTL